MADPLQTLQALLSQGATTGMQPQMGVSSRDGMTAKNPMAAALALMTGSPMGGNIGSRGTGSAGPATDGELYGMAQANQNVRGNLPKQPMGADYTGFTEDVQPMDDPRQTPMPNGPMPEQGYGYSPNVGARGAPGQSLMGAYLNRNKGAPSTEQELDMVQQKMGGDPSDNGDFPTNAEIRDMIDGKISEQQFDAKWGKGAAQELLSAQEDSDFDQGQPEQGKMGRRFSNPNTDKDPTTKKLPIDKQRAKGQADTGPDDDEY